MLPAGWFLLISCQGLTHMRCYFDRNSNERGTCTASALTEALGTCGLEQVPTRGLGTAVTKIVESSEEVLIDASWGDHGRRGWEWGSWDKQLGRRQQSWPSPVSAAVPHAQLLRKCASVCIAQMWSLHRFLCGCRSLDMKHPIICVYLPWICLFFCLWMETVVYRHTIKILTQSNLWFQDWEEGKHNSLSVLIKVCVPSVPWYLCPWYAKAAWRKSTDGFPQQQATGFLSQCCMRQMYRSKAPVCQGTSVSHRPDPVSPEETKEQWQHWSKSVLPHMVWGSRCGMFHLPKLLAASLCSYWQDIQKHLEMCLECRIQFSLVSVGDNCHDTNTSSWTSHSCALLDEKSFPESEIPYLYIPVF